MDRPSPELVNCPHCGAINPVIKDSCRSCERPLAIFIGPRPKVRTFRLADGMWWIAAIAVCLAVLKAEWACGIALSVLLLPALLRTTLTTAERKLDDRPMKGREIAAAFWVSLVVVFAIDFTAFLATALTAIFLGPALGRSVISDILIFLATCLAGGATCIAITRKLWPRKD